MSKNRNLINIKNEFNKGDNRIILLDLSYEVDKDINLDKKIEILNRCFEQINYNTDISNMVSIIKTIFANFKEEKLRIVLSKNDKINELVMYYNNRLSRYTSNIVFDNKEELLFSYNYQNGIDIKLTNKNKRLFDYNSVDLSNKITDRMCKTENLLKEDLRIVLNRNDRYLIKLYETIYNKKIDFNYSDIFNIFTSSLFLANEIGIQMPDSVYFYKLDSGITSNIIVNKIYNNFNFGLLLFDEVNTDDIVLSDSVKDLLKELGSVLKKNEDKVVSIANTLYNDKYCNNFVNSCYNTNMINKIKILAKNK